MKLDKSTKVLLNLVLILVIAFLIKSLIAVPKILHSEGNTKYKAVIFSEEMSEIETMESEKVHKLIPYESNIPEYVINKYAKKGWRLHSKVDVLNLDILIFER